MSGKLCALGKKRLNTDLMEGDYQKNGEETHVWTVGNLATVTQNFLPALFKNSDADIFGTEFEKGGEEVPLLNLIFSVSFLTDFEPKLRTS